LKILDHAYWCPIHRPPRQSIAMGSRREFGIPCSGRQGLARCGSSVCRRTSKSSKSSADLRYNRVGISLLHGRLSHLRLMCTGFRFFGRLSSHEPGMRHPISFMGAMLVIAIFPAVFAFCGPIERQVLYAFSNRQIWDWMRIRSLKPHRTLYTNTNMSI